MPRAPQADADPLIATRQSLIARLTNWDDQLRWQEFFETYWRLIYSVAKRAGLRDDESQEVVQETCISIARNIASYDPKLGPFKAWLLNTTRWRINDQFRRRKHENKTPDDTRRTAAIERIPDRAKTLNETWEDEWQRNLLDAGIARLKRKVDAKQFQIFDCVAIKGWTAVETAKHLSVNIAQVYLTKHRLKSLLKKEIRSLEK